MIQPVPAVITAMVVGGGATLLLIGGLAWLEGRVQARRIAQDRERLTAYMRRPARWIPVARVNAMQVYSPELCPAQEQGGVN